MKKLINKSSIFILLVIVILISSTFNNKICLVIQLIGCLFYLFFIFIKESKKILVYSYILFIMVTDLIGVFLIEFFDGRYLYEINQISYYKNSMFPISLYMLLNFYILSLINIEQIEIKKISNKFIDNVVLGLLLIIVIVFIKIIKNPIFMLNIDKYKYAKEHLDFSIKILINIYQYYLPLFLGYVYNNSVIKKTKRNIILICIFLSFILLCIGVKFGGFVHFFYWFSLPYVLLIKSEKQIKKRIFQFSIMVLILIIVSILHRIFNYGLDFLDGLKGLVERGFQQGQLWWGTYLKSDINYDNFINSEILNNNEKTRGIYKIMYEIGEKDFIDELYKIKATYTASTLSTIYLYFGIGGIYIFAIVFASLFVRLYISIIQNIKKCLLLNLILLTRIFVILISMFTMSKFHIDKFVELVLLIIGITIIKNYIMYCNKRRDNERKDIIYMPSSRKRSELD